MDSNVVRADFGSGLIRPRAQTCCALKSSAPSGAREASTQTPARLANSPGFKSFRCPRWRIKFSLERFSDQLHICLRFQPLESEPMEVAQPLVIATIMKRLTTGQQI